MCYVTENKSVIGWLSGLGWANLSRIGGVGQVVPKYWSKIRGGTMTFVSAGRLLNTRDGPGMEPGSDEMKSAKENLPCCCFGGETGLRHAWHCGQQPLRIFVTWACENLLGIARLYDFALMKNRYAVANSSDRG